MKNYFVSRICKVEDASLLIGFHVGGFAEIKLSDKFVFQPELLYSSQGDKESASFSEDGFTENFDTTNKISYLNIPLMAKYYVASNNSVGYKNNILFAFRGLYFGLLSVKFV